MAALLPGRVGRGARQWSDRITPAAARRLAAVVLGVGALLSIVAYRLMLRLGRLPEEERVLR